LEEGRGARAKHPRFKLQNFRMFDIFSPVPQLVALKKKKKGGRGGILQKCYATPKTNGCV
jgi:hypothetical protein